MFCHVRVRYGYTSQFTVVVHILCSTLKRAPGSHINDITANLLQRKELLYTLLTYNILLLITVTDYRSFVADDEAQYK